MATAHRVNRTKATDDKLAVVRDFLDSYDARLLGFSDINGTEVSMYLANARIIIFTSTDYGWDLFIPASDENDSAATLKGAEDRLGPRPGDANDPEWRKF
jgi:hypothetical protein